MLSPIEKNFDRAFSFFCQIKSFYIGLKTLVLLRSTPFFNTLLFAFQHISFVFVHQILPL